MTTGGDLTELVAVFAGDLAQALPDPAGWGIWLGLLLEELEKQAAQSGQPAERYDMALQFLRRAADERLESHK